MNVLVLNCGSSSIKFKLFRAQGDDLEELAAGTVDRPSDYQTAIRNILAGLPEQPQAVAHRVVHGGDRFRASTLLNDQLVLRLKELSSIAPLHNPPAIMGIEVAGTLGVPMVAVFDTAFHQTIPPRAAVVPLPKAVREKHGFRRYGFHGISHAYIARRCAEIFGRPANVISMHLGNGCSAAAIQEGVGVDTSMGYGPLEGLMMGTRPGDLDPTILLELYRKGHSLAEIDGMLNREGGLKALAGTPDMRALLSREDAEAKLAVEAFCYRARKYIGAYLAVLEGADAIVFTGGIGEKASEIRSRILKGFEWAGCFVDLARNEVPELRISTAESRLHAYVIPTAEEEMMAREAIGVLGK